MKFKAILILLASLLTASFINADEDFIEQVKKKFAAFQQKFPRVKVYLSFNQDVDTESVPEPEQALVAASAQ